MFLLDAISCHVFVAVPCRSRTREIGIAKRVYIFASLIGLKCLTRVHKMWDTSRLFQNADRVQLDKHFWYMREASSRIFRTRSNASFKRSIDKHASLSTGRVRVQDASIHSMLRSVGYYLFHSRVQNIAIINCEFWKSDLSAVLSSCLLHRFMEGLRTTL